MEKHKAREKQRLAGGDKKSEEAKKPLFSMLRKAIPEASAAKEASKEANVSFREPKNPFLTGKASKEANVDTDPINTAKLVAKDAGGDRISGQSKETSLVKNSEQAKESKEVEEQPADKREPKK